MKDDDESIENMRYAIRLFELALGLNINLSKSTIFPINSDFERTNSVAAKWGIFQNSLPYDTWEFHQGQATIKKILG